MLFGGFLLNVSLLSLFIGPEAALHLGEDLDHYEQWPAVVRALFSPDGLVLCGVLFGVPLGIFMLWRMSSAKGRPAGEALGLKWPTGWQALSWGSLILFVAYTVHALTDKYGGSPEEESNWQAIFQVPLLIPLVVAFAVLWPILDELLFRGFILDGLLQARLGEVKAILLTSLFWAATRGSSVGFWGAFLIGLTFAYARLRTGSTFLTIAVQLVISLAWVVSMAGLLP
jgi:membrane protease YdiL (CAAX protease family)